MQMILVKMKMTTIVAVILGSSDHYMLGSHLIESEKVLSWPTLLLFSSILFC
jgi:hypothetical protein